MAAHTHAPLSPSTTGLLAALVVSLAVLGVALALGAGVQGAGIRGGVEQVAARVDRDLAEAIGLEPAEGARAPDLPPERLDVRLGGRTSSWAQISALIGLALVLLWPSRRRRWQKERWRSSGAVALAVLFGEGVLGLGLYPIRWPLLSFPVRALVTCGWVFLGIHGFVLARERLLGWGRSSWRWHLHWLLWPALVLAPQVFGWVGVADHAPRRTRMAGLALLLWVGGLLLLPDLGWAQVPDASHTVLPPENLWEAYWWGFRHYGLLLYLAPPALVALAAKRLGPTERRDLGWLLLILGAAALIRLTLPAPGFFKEAHHARDLGLRNISEVAFGLWPKVAEMGIWRGPDSLLFALNGLLGWLTVPLVYLGGRALGLRSSIALVAAAFAAIAPMHIKYGASEAMTVSAGYLWGCALLLLLWWVEHRSVVAALLWLLIIPVLIESRPEGSVLLGTVGLVATARGWRRWTRRDWLRGALLVAVAILLSARLVERLLPTHGDIGFLRQGPLLAPFELMIRWAGALVSVEHNAFLDPRTTPVLCGLAFAAGALLPAPEGQRRVRRTALLAFVTLFLPYAMASTSIEALGEARYQAALIVPGSWLVGLGAAALAGGLRETAAGPWAAALLRPRWIAGLVGLNLLALAPELRSRAYDVPASQAFLSDLSRDPELQDLRFVISLAEPDRDLNDLLREGDVLAKLAEVVQQRPVDLVEPERFDEVLGGLERFEHVYLYEGVFCSYLPERCAAAMRRFDLEKVRGRRVPARHFTTLRPDYARPEAEELELALYRVRGWALRPRPDRPSPGPDRDP